MSSDWGNQLSTVTGNSSSRIAQDSFSSKPKNSSFASIFHTHPKGIKLPPYLQDTSFELWVREKEKKISEDSPSEIHLPTAWNPADKNSLLEISKQGLRIAYTGAGKNDLDVAAVRANHSMPQQAGLFYFEVEIISKGREGLIGIGFCTKSVKLNRHPGWENHSWGYHGDDGNSFCCSGAGTPYGPTFTTNDIIGCGVNFRTNTGFYTKNGIFLGTAFKDIKGILFPSVGLRTPGEVIEVNFGQKAFAFDISHYMKEEKARLWQSINSTQISADGSLSSTVDSSTNCAKSDNSSSIINLLITSYLVHHGYCATAKSFVQNSLSIDLGDNSSMEEETLPVGDSLIASKIRDELGAGREEDIITRQEIRDYVLTGDIQNAIQLTEQVYPQVFVENPDILFQLQCRRFVEIIRSIEEENNSMENSHEISEENNHNSLKHFKSLAIEDAIEFGQKLQTMYGSSENPEIRKTLVETFSLLAYQQASKSVVAYLLEPSVREPVANKLNSAILVSLGRPPIPALELIFRQSCLVTKNLVENNVGDGSFINVHKDCLL